jgi:peptide/nickel transport system permease protein
VDRPTDTLRLTNALVRRQQQLNDRTQVSGPPRTPARDAWRHLRRNPVAIAGATILGFLLLVAILAPVVAPYDPTAQTLNLRNAPPSAEHLLGLDALGRDVLSRVMYGARISLFIGFFTVGGALIVGTMVGAVAGYVGGRTDNLLMRLMDILLAFPSLLLAIGVVAILGRGLMNALYAIAFVSIPVYARIARASILSIKELDYVEAARAIGAGPGRILFRVIMPNALTPLIVQATLGIGTAILEAAALSFIGLGAQAPEPEWGLMLAQHRNLVFTAPHTVFFPGLAIMLTVLGFNLLGDGVRDALDPRLRG